MRFYASFAPETSLVGSLSFHRCRTRPAATFETGLRKVTIRISVSRADVFRLSSNNVGPFSRNLVPSGFKAWAFAPHAPA